MSLIGWLAGTHILDLISGFDHWVAFGLLTVIGCRMLYEALREETGKLLGSLSVGVLLALSVATSIDALAVGLSFSFLRISIVVPAFVIGVVAFSLSFLGVYLGGKVERFVRNRVEILGGLILIIIGAKILVEHLGIV